MARVDVSRMLKQIGIPNDLIDVLCLYQAIADDKRRLRRFLKSEKIVGELLARLEYAYALGHPWQEYWKAVKAHGYYSAVASAAREQCYSLFPWQYAILRGHLCDCRDCQEADKHITDAKQACDEDDEIEGR